MIENFNDNKKNDRKILTIIIVGFLFVVWLCTPPGNKFAQMCFWGNQTQLFWAKLTNNAETKEWLIHRNNAVYNVRMGRKEDAILEMDKAIDTLPVYMDKKLSSLYKDRAQLRIYYEDYKGALSDYLKVENLNMMDKFKVAMLYKSIGQNKLGVEYCNSILNLDPKAYMGYVCIADIYAGVGRYDTSVRVFDLLISRSPNNAGYYLDRAQYKELAGDNAGANEDRAKAKEVNSIANNKISLVEQALHPKVLGLQIIRN